MREIALRAWSPSTKTMGEAFDLREELTTDHLADNTDRWLADTFFLHYTGLKDRNGVEICEGDILQRPSSINGDYHGNWIRDEVIYKPGQWFVSHIASEKGKLPRGYTAGPLLSSYFDYDGKPYAFADDYEPECEGEVIGNIYENPELLESAR